MRLLGAIVTVTGCVSLRAEPLQGSIFFTSLKQGDLVRLDCGGAGAVERGVAGGFEEPPGSAGGRLVPGQVPDAHDSAGRRGPSTPR